MVRALALALLAAGTTADPDLPAEHAQKIAPELVAGAGARVFLSPRWTLTPSLRQFAYLRPKTASGAGGGPGLPEDVDVVDYHSHKGPMP